MHYDSVLMYVRKVLENRGIPSFLFREPFEDIESLDMGLRESLMEDFDINHLKSLQNAARNILFIILQTITTALMSVCGFPLQILRSFLLQGHSHMLKLTK